MSNNRGSEWSKWDLHIHSPKTWLAGEYGETTIDQFVKRVEDSGIKVIGLTNYFKFSEGEIDGDDNLKSKLEAKDITVFPNLEFRLDQKNKGNEQINIHILFRNNLEVTKIKGFLGRLKTVDGKWCNKLTEQDIGSVVVGKDTLFDTLKGETDIKPLIDYLIIGCPNGHGGFRPCRNDDGRGNSIAIELDKRSNALFSSEKNPEDDRQFYLNCKKDNQGNPIIRYDGAKIKPVFIASDAHRMDGTDDHNGIGDRFSWVKALPTFDGLIQVLFNPAERVRFQDGKPIELKSDGMIIDKLAYGDNNDKEILFSYDLSSIIGMRGNGKSILLKAIASKVDEEDYVNKISEGKAKSDKDWRDKHFKNLKIIWKDGAEDAGTDENPKKVFYLPQGYLSNLAYDENANKEERYEFLRGLLRKNNEFSNAERQAKNFVDNNRLSINSDINQIFIDFDNIQGLEDENKGIGGITSIERELKAIEQKSKEISGKYKISEDDKTNYQKASNDKKTLASQIKIISQDITILNGISDDTKTVQIDDFVFSRLSPDIKQTLSHKLEENSKKTIKEIVPEQVKLLKERKIKLEVDLNNAEKVLKELTPKFEQQKELDGLIKKESELKNNKAKIEKNQKDIKEKTGNKDRLLDEVKNKYFSYKKEQDDYFNTVNLDDFEFIRIEIKIKKSAEQFDRFISENINTTRLQGLREETRKFISGEKHELTEDNFEAIFNDILYEKITLLKQVKDKKQTILELLQNPYNIEFLDSIMLNDKNKTLFRNMTGGQKAIAMLELIFKFDRNKYPILLDQPEDDLDTSGVANNIVKFIQRQKEDRQIFVVSHNGSLVVCSDSEEIIVAENKDGIFQYTSGAIEEEDIRSKIIDILEGGKDALRLRMNKLRVEL